MTDSDFGPLRQQLVESLAGRGVFREPWLRDAFEAVHRHWFVPDRVWTWRGERWWPVNRHDDEPKWAGMVYHESDAVVTQVDDGHTAEDGSGLVPTSSISASGGVVNMLASLDPQPGEFVGEIGTGTGFNTALLCERLGQEHVFSKEVDPAVAAHARRALASAGYEPEVRCGDGEEGFPEQAPYDRLISTASVHRVPQAWLEQVRPGGEIVTPWLPNGRALGLMWLRVTEPGVARGWFHGGETFMPVRGQRPERPDLPALWNATRAEAKRVSGPVDLGLDVHGEFALEVTLPGVTPYRQDGGWFFLTDDRSSWLRTTGEGVTQYGRCDLFGDVQRALEWWRRSGRPELFDFGVTVTPEAQTITLGKERAPVPVLRS